MAATSHNMTCAMASQTDELLSVYAKRLGASRVWLLRGGKELIISQLCDALNNAGVSELEKERALALSGSEPDKSAPLSLYVQDVLSLSPLHVHTAPQKQDSRLFFADITSVSSSLCAPCSRGFDAAIEQLDLTLPTNNDGLSVVGLSDSRHADAWHAQTLDVLARLLDELSQTQGFALAPWDAVLVAGRLETADERIRAASDVAQELASYLVCHPHVASAHYPGLKTDTSFALASSLFHHGFGPWLEYRAASSTSFELLCTLNSEKEPCSLKELIAQLETEL